MDIKNLAKEILEDFARCGHVSDTNRAKSFLYELLKKKLGVVNAQARAKENVLNSQLEAATSKIERMTTFKGIEGLGFHDVSKAWHFDPELFEKEVEVGIYNEQGVPTSMITFVEVHGKLVVRQFWITPEIHQVLTVLMINMKGMPTLKSLLATLRELGVPDLTETKKRDPW